VSFRFGREGYNHGFRITPIAEEDLQRNQAQPGAIYCNDLGAKKYFEPTPGYT
jgi:hypothetical protein